MTEMGNPSSSTAKIMKKLKVDNFTFKSANEISVQCITGSDLSDPANYEYRSVNINEFAAFLRRNKYPTQYDIESGFPLLRCDLAQFLNEKEGRTEEMEEPKFHGDALRIREENPITNILSHVR